MAEEVKMDMEGNCYDQFNNYLGKGMLKDGVLKITQVTFMLLAFVADL